MTIEFEAFPKIARLNRDVVITEKIDGTNAAVVIEETEGGTVEIGAQSRKRLITPDDDNFGFAAWVWEHSEQLIKVLGPGRHFGEWWGSGIQRGYGLKNGEKRFSLFNTKRWWEILGVQTDATTVPGLRVVPIIAAMPMFDSQNVEVVLDDLQENGSWAEPGFRNPEGVVVYHTHGNHLYKVTLEGDSEPKSLRQAA